MLPTPPTNVPYFSERAKKILLLIGAGVGVYFLIKALNGFRANFGERQEVQNASDELNKLNENPSTRQKLSSYQALQIANAIHTAMDGWGTNEEAIYTNLRLLKNNADWLAITKAYGSREIDSGRGNISPNMTGTLTQCLQEELDSNERKKVNEILKIRNIRFRV